VSAFPLLSTKLNLPPRRSTLVARPRLLGMLDLSLLPGNRLTILSAPAGFGKTTLVVDWQSSLAERGIPLAWLGVDAGDNDLVRFMRYFIAALQKVQPDLGQAALSVLELPQLPQVESLVVPLINEIEAGAGDFVLVLDDFQVITDLAVTQAVNYLVDHQPARLHLVLTTRTDPLLPLARLRARGEVNEIRSADLRFTGPEAVDFIQRAAKLALTPDQVSVLDRSTEGWIAGLQIAAIALQAFASRQADGAGIDEFLASFSGKHQYVFDYLAQEVLKQLSPGVIEFLYQTSFLTWLSPELCDAVTGRNDSAAILRNLDQSNLFILPLDERRQMYRYHHLFADFLGAGLDADRLAELNRRASAWCEQKGLVEEAISYAQAAADWTAAVRLIRRAIAGNLESGEVMTLNRWLEDLPVAVLYSDPDLCITLAWILVLRTKIESVPILMEQAENALEREGSSATFGRLLGFKAQIAWGMGDAEQAIHLAERAVSLIDPSDGFFRTMCLNLLGQLERAVGNVAHSIAAFQEAIHATENRTGRPVSEIDFGLALLRGNLIYSYTEHGELRRANALCRQWISHYVMANGQIHPAALFIYILWANVCYEMNNLEDARRYVLQGFELCRKMGANPTVIGGPTLYAALQLLEGDKRAALETVRAYAEDARRMQLRWVVGWAAAFEARFQMALGNLAEAEAWAKGADLPPLNQSVPIRITEQLMHARLLIAQKHYDDAQTLLHVLGARSEQREDLHELMEIDILLAQALDGLGRADEALASIENAARLAAPEGSLRCFLDNDATDLVDRLRSRLQGQSHEALIAFLDQVLALPSLSQTIRGEEPAARVVLTAPRPITRPGLAEPITPRELEVLELMSQGLQNTEIARKLFLTVNTLKAHTNSIYGKLDVHSRLQAVNRARELGILGEKKN